MMLLVMLVLLLLPLPLMPLGVSPALVWGAEIAAVLLWFRPLTQWPLKDKSVAVTVEDVVVAAKTKQWPIAYDQVP